MLISDWSSDVCSSDLSARFRTEIRPPCRHAPSGTAGSASAGRRLQEDREHPRSPSGPASAVWSRASPYPSRIHSFARSLLVRTSASGILDAWEIGRAHVLTPVTNAHIVCRLMLEKKTNDIT